MTTYNKWCVKQIEHDEVIDCTIKDIITNINSIQKYCPPQRYLLIHHVFCIFIV